MFARICHYVPAISILLMGQLAVGQAAGGGTEKPTPPQPGDVKLWIASRGGARSELLIGVAVSPVPPVMSLQLKLPARTGLVVENVVPGSAAERAGIRQYDVIERIDNRRVASAAQVEQILSGHKAGERVPLLIVREGDHMNMEVPITSEPSRRRSPDSLYDLSQKYLPDGFQFSPDQTRQWEQMSEKLKKEVQQQEQQIERLKENLRREADQARRELEQLKEQIRRELEQQKRQMIDQLNEKPNRDKATQDKEDRDKSDEDQSVRKS
jgi:hypothetical protein